MKTAAQKLRPKQAPETRRSQAQAAPAATPRYLRASLKLGGLNDPQEHEAEHAARVVAAGGSYRVRDPGGADSLRAEPVDPGASGRIKRKPAALPASADKDAARRIEAARGAVARPLPAPVRARLEHGFGQKMSDVRVHTGPDAHAAAAAIGARAYTEGNRITLGHGESEHDLHLMAHEATHVVQNRAAAPKPAARRKPADTREPIRRSEAPPATQTPIRRFGLSLDSILEFFGEKANLIPGFRMFTIILGVNPVTMQAVDRSAANILRAVVELMPLGALIVQALDKYGVFEKAGAWVSQQIDTLQITGSAIADAVSSFLHSLHLGDVFHPGDVWDRAKKIFTEPIERIKNFVISLVEAVVAFVKDAVLKPLAALASKTPAWDLLTGILGKNPITGDEVPQNAETLIGGLLKLAGKDEIFENLKKSHGVARATAWFKGAVAALVGFVKQIPTLFLNALKSFVIGDLLDLPGAIGRVLGLFGDFAGRFISWAGDAAWNLLEIIFDVVSPGAFGYVKKTGAALKSILKNPLPFVGNLVQAAKLGLQNFASNILTHLKAGLINWLTGALPGVYIPKAISLVEVGKFALSVLGISWAQIRAKIVKALGPSGETIMAALEKTFDVVVALFKGGPAAAWEVIKERLTNLKDLVIDGITGFVIDTIVSKAIPKLVSLFIPGAGFISAIVSIYGTITTFIAQLSKITAAIKAFVDSIVAIAAGQIEGAASRVEAALAGVLSLAISLLASFLGLGNVAGKVLALVEKVRAVVDRALDTAIAWIVGKAKALFAKLFGKAGKKEDQAQAGRADAPFRFMGHPHTLRLQEDGGRIAVLVASGAFSPFKQKLALLRANAIELDVSPDNLSKLDQAIAKASQFADSIAGKPLAGRALRDELKGGDIGAELDNVGADISEKWNTTVPLQTRVLYAHRVYRLTGHGAVSDLLSTGKPEFMAELTNQQGAQILVSYRYYRTTYSTESGTWINWSAGHPDGDRWIDPKTGLVRAEVDIRDDLYWKGNWPSANLGWKKAQIANAKARARDPARKPLLDAYLSRVPGAGQNVIYLPAVPGFGEKMWDATNDASVHIDHIVPLGEHWLSGHGSAPGNDSEHDARRTFYLDSSNHQILDGPTNSAKGGDHFVRTVKPGFRGPT